MIRKYCMAKKKLNKVKRLFCSFCNKSQSQVRNLISGADVYICNECIEGCNHILDNHYTFKIEKNIKKYMEEARDLPRSFKHFDVQDGIDLIEAFFKELPELKKYMKTRIVVPVTPR